MYEEIGINIPPGVVKSDTPNGVKERWIDTQLVRFWQQRPERWRGWRKLITSVVDGEARGMVAWRTLAGHRVVAIGTPNKLWLVANGQLYDITPAGLPTGIVNAVETTAWSGGAWGANAWGGAVPLGQGANGGNPHTWSLALWGEDLIACRRGGKLYRWDASAGFATPAAEIVGAPIANLGVFVTEDRHLVAYGAHNGSSEDLLRIAWANRETLDEWTPMATNTAGDLRCDSGNEIISAIPIAGGHLILTDLSAYAFEYIGGKFIFALRRRGAKNGAVGPNSGVEVNGTAVWWGDDGFYSYDGNVRPLDCDVHAHVFDDVNRANAHKIYCATNTAYREVIWFYPAGDSVVCNRYVAMGPDGWSIGTLDRSSWIDNNVLVGRPLAVDNAGVIYEHDIGTTDANGVELAYRLESGEIAIRKGREEAGRTEWSVRRFYPDFTAERTTGTHTLTIETRTAPQQSARTKGPYSYDDASRSFSPRARAASMRLLFEGAGDFRMGEPLLMATMV